MPSKRKRAVAYDNPQGCVFCRKEDDNESMFGKLYHLENFSVHHNCLFFASGLAQDAENKLNGILGFKIEDIKKEANRGNKLPCFYCKHYGATVGCAVTSCRRTFHFPCGKNNQTLHQYFGCFNSYCDSHKPVQENIKTPRDAFQCHICYTSLSKNAKEKCLYAPCCKNNWYHKTCLQQYATSAGRYFFKCPKCNNSADFIEVMQTYGINIPEKDASWELEENAYQDLYCRPECGAAICECNKGRKHNDSVKDDGKWKLLFCKLCGSTARHRFCENLGRSVDVWECSECKGLEDIIKKNVSQTQASGSTQKVSSKITLQKFCLTDLYSNEDLVSDCIPSCNTFYLSSGALSDASLRRALRCEVRLTPLQTKVITNANGVQKPVLNTLNKSVNASKSLLNVNTESGKSNVTPTEITKKAPNNDNIKRNLSRAVRYEKRVTPVQTKVITNSKVVRKLVSNKRNKSANASKSLLHVNTESGKSIVIPTEMKRKLSRAVRCEKRATPVQTNVNVVQKPELSKSDKSANDSKSLLNVNTESGKSNVTPTLIMKVAPNNENSKKKLSHPPVNIRPCLKIKEINTIKSVQLTEDSASRASERSVKVKRANPVNIKNPKSVKAKPIKTNRSKPVKANSVKSHAKNIRSPKKRTNCCSNNTCISKYFGFECPKLKINRL